MPTLGRHLMQLRLEALAEAEKVQAGIEVQGVSYDYQRRSQREYVLLFGELHVSAYLRRNRSFMDYQHYLALGWPIGIGVVEGACRHLVKDRFEQAGMRWSKVGARTLLDIRSVAFNGDWDDFKRLRRQQSHLQHYASPYPDTLPDIWALEEAA